MNRSSRNHQHLSEDEALARSLQMQYEREAAATNPTNQPANISLRDRRRIQLDDEEYARRLAAREEAVQASEAVAAATTRSSSKSRTSARVRGTQASGGFVFPGPDGNMPAPTYVTDKTSRETSVSKVTQVGGNSGDGDAPPIIILEEHKSQEQRDLEYAQRVEQELQDELVAERLQRKEQELIDRRRVQEQARLQQPEHQRELARMRRRKLFWLLLTLAILVGAVFSVIYYFVIQGGKLPNWTPEDFAKEDPFNQVKPQNAPRWKNNGRGLYLNVINALETKWYQYFYNQLDLWQNGYPKCLSLTSEFSTSGAGNQGHEVNCTPVTGKLKVCNGNYGDTRWKGINEVLIDANNRIVASAARMNEYYLSSNNDDDMSYTMCHEMGHGWGCPHTDETFGNPDLGDCMDYTNTPKDNRQPALRNFAFLYQLYGIIPGSTPYSPAPTRSPSNSSIVSSKANVGGGRRLVGKGPPPTLVASSSSKTTNEKLQSTIDVDENDGRPLPDWLTASIHLALDRHTGRRLQTHTWQLLHLHPNGEVHQVELPRGYQLRVRYLWAEAAY